MVISLRRKVEYYNGKEITRAVLKRVNLIDLKRIQEGITQFAMEEVKSLKSLCEAHEVNPEDEHLIIGEDWYILYTDISDIEIEIKDWVAIGNVDNKLMQTMEMFNALKKVLLAHEDHDIHGTLRHSTSYKFYKKFLDEGYLEEGLNILDFDDEQPRLAAIKEKILSEYDSLYDYLADENRERYENDALEDYIYYDVCFNITDAFKKRYKK